MELWTSDLSLTLSISLFRIYRGDLGNFGCEKEKKWLFEDLVDYLITVWKVVGEDIDFKIKKRIEVRN